jgi:cyclopropane-fatty-acyl-phospholipid synthase
MRVAVVGAGVAGLTAAHELARSSGGVRVTLYEKEHHLGGGAGTVAVDDDGNGPVHLDLGFMVFNWVRTSYPRITQIKVTNAGLHYYSASSHPVLC